MLLIIVVVGFSIAILLSIAVSLWVRHKNERERQRKAVEWDEWADAVNTMIVRLDKNDPSAWREIREHDKYMYKFGQIVVYSNAGDLSNAFVKAHGRYAVRLQVLQAVEQLQRMRDDELEVSERIAVGVRLLQSFGYANAGKAVKQLEKLGIDNDAVTEEFKSLCQAEADRLFSRIRAGSWQEAYPELMELVQTSKYSGRYAEHPSPVAWPADWHKLVAKNVANPNCVTFQTLRRYQDLAQGTVRLWAAKALKKDDLTQAKIVLAYANHWERARLEVGDVLLAELAKLVERHHANHPLPAVG